MLDAGRFAIFALLLKSYFPKNVLGYALLHQYSFNDGTARDLVGGSAFAGTLMAGATVTGNQATFATSGPYVNLPSGLFGSYMAVTVEAWVTTGVNTGWPRIFQFGASVTLSQANSFTVYRESSTNKFSLCWRDSTATQYAYSDVAFNSQSNFHVVMTISIGDYARLYINGVLQTTTAAVVSSIPPPTVFYIGKSFKADTGLVGSVNEFRIWGGALSATDIATRYSQGPGDVFVTMLQIV